MYPTLKYHKVNPNLTAPMVIAWFHVCMVYLHHDVQPEMTSACDGKHSDKSSHYHGNAFDVSVAGLSDDMANTLRRDIEESLNVHYDVILELESTHIHVQFKPRGGHFFK